MSGGRPPTNTFREYRSIWSDNSEVGEQLSGSDHSEGTIWSVQRRNANSQKSFNDVLSLSLIRERNTKCYLKLEIDGWNKLAKWIAHTCYGPYQRIFAKGNLKQSAIMKSFAIWHGRPSNCMLYGMYLIWMTFTHNWMSFTGLNSFRLTGTHIANAFLCDDYIFTFKQRYLLTLIWWLLVAALKILVAASGSF